MAERADHDRAPEQLGCDAEPHDPGDALQAAVRQERHRTAARRLFDAAPLYRVEFEEDGTVSLRRKGYEYWPERPPAAATRWGVVSRHPDLEQAERRLRHLSSPHIYYDEQGQLARAPTIDGDDAPVPEKPWRG
jgi:hypothetical protein